MKQLKGRALAHRALALEAEQAAHLGHRLPSQRAWARRRLSEARSAMRVIVGPSGLRDLEGLDVPEPAPASERKSRPTDSLTVTPDPGVGVDGLLDALNIVSS